MPKMVLGQFTLVRQLPVLLSYCQHKRFISYKWFIAVLSDVLLKPSPPFVFFPQYAAALLDNLIKLLFPLKEKSTTDKSLDLSLSWGS